MVVVNLRCKILWDSGVWVSAFLGTACAHVLGRTCHVSTALLGNEVAGLLFEVSLRFSFLSLISHSLFLLVCAFHPSKTLTLPPSP